MHYVSVKTCIYTKKLPLLLTNKIWMWQFFQSNIFIVTRLSNKKKTLYKRHSISQNANISCLLLKVYSISCRGRIISKHHVTRHDTNYNTSFGRFSSCEAFPRCSLQTIFPEHNTFTCCERPILLATGTQQPW